MKKFKTFIVDDDRTDGGTMLVDNNTVLSSSQRKALPNNPDGWQQMAIGWERNLIDHGIIRNYSLALKFVRDGAKILRKTLFSETVERKISLLITMLSLKLTSTKFAFQYNYLYKGDIDPATITDGPYSVAANIMEGQLIALKKANEATLYSFAMNDPKAINVYCDGIKLFQKLNYVDISDYEIKLSDTGTAFLGPALNTGIDGKSSGIFISSETIESVGGLTFAAKISSKNIIIQNTNSFSVDIVIAGRIEFICTAMTSAPAYAFKSRYLTSSMALGNQNDYVLITTPAMTVGQTYGSNFTIPITLKANETLLKENIFFGGPGTEAVIKFTNNSVYSISFHTQFIQTIVKMFTLYDFYPKIIGKVTGSEDNAVSELLANNKNICITCGDAIRGFTAAEIKTKLVDFLISTNVQFSSGIGIENNKLALESRAHFYDNSNPIPLGEIKMRPKSYLAKDLIHNTIRIGSEPNDYTDINGRDEFNNSTIFTSPITRVVAQLDLVSRYRRDCFGFEYTRINFDGKLTTDSNNDNNIWLVNVATNVPTPSTAIYTGPFEMIAPQFIKIPLPISITDTQIIITGSSVSDGTYQILNTTFLVLGYIYLTVAQTVVNAVETTGNISQGGIRPYALARETYDTITGVLSPDTIFNVKDMSIKRLIEHHKAWLAGMFYGFAGKQLPFSVTDKNAKLYTSKAGVVYDEKANINIADLGAPLFIPIYMEIEVKVPVNLPALLENNPAKCFSFTWGGKTYKGFLFKAGISISDNAQQVFKLLSTPDNDLSTLI
jgi:hypothetical protein